MDSETFSHLWFGAFRLRPFPTLYEENKTPVTVDVLEVGWIVAFVTFALAVYFIIPGQPKPFLAFIRATLALFLGLVIMFCNFGQRWEVGHVKSTMPYRAGTGQEIEADIGVRIGLRAINITLKADSPSEGVLMGEKINYNERFSWTWTQGRAGFGPMAGRIQRDFRYHQRRGTPLPILWIAEYFTFDGEGLRFGRHYRLAGWYAHMCLWLALPSWLLSMILFNMVIKYGARMLFLTGFLMFLSSILWAAIRNSFELEIPFDPPQHILKTKFGVDWWLALIVGSIAMVHGVTILVLDYYMHERVCEWFGINPLIYPEYEVITNDSREGGEDNPSAELPGDIEMRPKGSGLLKRIEGLRRSVTVRVRGRGSSNKDWKVQQVTEEEECLPPPPASLLTPYSGLPPQDADLGEYSFSGVPGYEAPSIPQIVTPTEGLYQNVPSTKQ